MKIAGFEPGPEIPEEVMDYIGRVFPCEGPKNCNSFGVCNHCCDASLILVGVELVLRHYTLQRTSQTTGEK